jgi:multiple antibiotic resistance protein
MDIFEIATTVLRNMLLLLAVANPIGNIPVFADLMGQLEQGERKHVMNLAVITALGIVIVFSLVGNWALIHLFNVTVMELRIAGGILLFIVAIHGMMPQDKPYSSSKDPRMIAVFPIACPMLVGPGAITMTIIITQSIGHLLMIITALITFLFVFLIVRNALRLTQLLGPYIGAVVARLLYIMLAAKAVAMILVGIREFYGQLQNL